MENDNFFVHYLNLLTLYPTIVDLFTIIESILAFVGKECFQSQFDHNFSNCDYNFKNVTINSFNQNSCTDALRSILTLNSIFFSHFSKCKKQGMCYRTCSNVSNINVFRNLKKERRETTFSRQEAHT